MSYNAITNITDSDDYFHMSNVEDYREKFQNALTEIHMPKHFETSKFLKRRSTQSKEEALLQ